jgi:DNA uptake protein ComE-like DNA-binding protein
MKPVATFTFTVITACALASGLYAGDPAMCGAPAGAKTSSGTSAHPSDGKSSVQRSAEECAAQLAPERQSDLLILLNEANEARLLTIDGVASTRAAAIMAARPIGSLTDLVGIKGIGLTTFKRILAHDPAAIESASVEAPPGSEAQADR